MLGKLFVTSQSVFEKMESTNERVVKALNDKVASDAASRTALNKFHTALSKALTEAGKSQKMAIEDTASPMADDGISVMEEANESSTPDDGEIKLEPVGEEGMTEGKDSILEELLDYEDDTL